MFRIKVRVRIRFGVRFRDGIRFGARARTSVGVRATFRHQRERYILLVGSGMKG